MSNVRVEKNRDILIIGAADSNKHLKEIVYADSTEEVEKEFGADSELAKAYKLAKSLGAPYVFLLNIRHDYQYADIIDVLAQNDFAYIAPINLYLSQPYDDIIHDRRTPYVQHILKKIGRSNESVFIVTDKHASLYEDIDSYLEDMNQISEGFYLSTGIDENLENILFVLNNLERHNMANVALAAALSASPIGEYPVADFGPAIFDIDAYEPVQNYAYFMNHGVRETTVENLLNYLNGSILKVVTISRIVKAIKRALDFSEFIGINYSARIPVSIRQKLIDYLNSIMGKLIYRYNIIEVQPYRIKGTPTVRIDSLFEVWPNGSFEKCRIDKSIEVS